MQNQAKLTLTSSRHDSMNFVRDSLRCQSSEVNLNLSQVNACEECQIAEAEYINNPRDADVRSSPLPNFLFIHFYFHIHCYVGNLVYILFY